MIRSKSHDQRCSDGLTFPTALESVLNPTCSSKSRNTQVKCKTRLRLINSSLEQKTKFWFHCNIARQKEVLTLSSVKTRENFLSFFTSSCSYNLINWNSLTSKVLRNMELKILSEVWITQIIKGK